MHRVILRMEGKLGLLGRSEFRPVSGLRSERRADFTGPELIGERLDPLH